MSLRLEQITPGSKVTGIDGIQAVDVVNVEWFGDSAITVTFRGDQGPREVILYRDDEMRLNISSTGRAFSFDGDGETYRLASEAQRIRLAHLFDPFIAIHSSRIQALPHQITAVYGELLMRQPLRYLLADDPGAGKTIMAGLFIKELLIRGELERCMIIAPGSLVEQWQDELKEKFNLDFEILSRDQIESMQSANPFIERSRLIVRLDMASRSEELQEKLRAAPDWDLIICDEAHRMSASLFGNEVKQTKRYKLGLLAGERTRNFLLMTATPHNGKDEDFQLFMGLIDGDRFEGRQREGARRPNASDLMRRLTKEELRKFDGSPLFPERKAYTVQYQLSDLEARLYEAVTEYVRNEMNRADRLSEDGKRRNNVGFALQILQRRLASSPAAIYQSLRRRRERLDAQLQEERLLARGATVRLSKVLDVGDYDDEDADLEESGGEELERAEQQIVDRATAAETIAELEAEILILKDLEHLADRLRKSGEDTKWKQLSEILDKPPMFDEATAQRRKLLIFTEPRDTLEYLAERIRQRVGKADSVKVIHGGVPREQRKAAIAAFNDDPEVRVLIANDAAGEGVNLQRGAHLMVNYDLPWNPNRLEQRFGRIHRIGQTEVCHLWNLVAGETREGEVYVRLLEKLEEARRALGGRDSVYDVLGELFEGRPLRDLLVEAIRYGEEPERKRKLFTAVDGVVNKEAISALLKERKLTSEGLDPSMIAEIRIEMERAEARRLQPRYIQSFFAKAFERQGGQMRRREAGRFEITRVPSRIRDRDRVTGTGDPVLERYERVCFDKLHIDGKPQAALVTPGHSLLDSTLAVTLEESGDVLKRGTILVDETGSAGSKMRILIALEHAIKDGRGGRSGQANIVSRRLQFIFMDEAGRRMDAGPAPYLDFRALREAEKPFAAALLDAPWLSGDVEKRALGFAISELVPEHLKQVRDMRLAKIDQIEAEVRSRLRREISYWDTRAEELALREQAGQQPRLNSAKAKANAQRLADRLERRLRELAQEKEINALPPVLKGACLVVPVHLLDESSTTKVKGVFEDDAASRLAVELAAMQAVMESEQALGRIPSDVSARKCGYDIESFDPTTGSLKFIEVKGRSLGAEEIIVTRNEILTALNAEDKFILAIVSIGEGGFAHEPIYVRRPFESEPDFHSTAVVYPIGKLIAKGGPPS